MLNHWIRYFPILDLIPDDETKRVLEVGSGNTGLGEFLTRPFIGSDISFGPDRFSPSMTPVVASGTHLPFQTGSISLVLCLDTLEHVPRRDRADIVRELIRVSGHAVVIACPMGMPALKSDEDLQDWYNRQGRTAPVWLREHIALANDFPELDEVVSAATTSGYSCVVRDGEGAELHRILSRLEDRRITGRLTRILSRRPWRWMVRTVLHAVGMSGSYRKYVVVTKT